MAVDLISNFKEKTAKIKDPGINREAEFDVMYSTGFLSMDYMNGTVIYVSNEELELDYHYNSTGIVDGSANVFIGRPASGKSTLTMQVAGNIIRPYIQKGMPTSLMVDDIEGSLPESRKQFLLGLTEKEMEKYTDIRNTGITTNNVLQRIRELRDLKLNNRKEFEYDTGLHDVKGKRIFKLIPSVYVIDSLPMLLPKDLADDDELGGSMSASAIAKANTMMSKQITQWCKEANIIFFTINHILDDIQMGYTPKPVQIAGLKQGERLPAGKATMYLANNMFRTDDSTLLKPTEGFGIDGSIVRLTLVKSRTNVTRKSIPLIFNKTEGRFDDILSLFQLVKEDGRFLGGAGAYLYMKELPEEKFAQKTFKEKLEASTELQQVFAKAAYTILSAYLSDTKVVQKDLSTASSNIINIFNELSTAA